MKNILMTKKHFLFIALFFVCASLSAQLKCSFRHYSSEDGLSQNTVMNILQDHKGNIWLATWDGINKFDGYDFKTYKASQENQISLTSNRVDMIREDDDGYIWMLSYDNRAHRFDPGTETFEAVPALGAGSDVNITEIKVIPGGSVWLITENEGVIRAMTDSVTHDVATQVYSLQSGLFPCLKVHDVCRDSDGNEWLLTDNGLAMVKPGVLAPVGYFVETKETGPDQKQMFYAFCEKDGEIFFGSDKGRLWRFQKEEGQFHLLELPTRQNIIGVNILSENEIAATTASGLYVYDLKLKRTTASYTAASHPVLAGVTVKSTYSDRHHELWMELDKRGQVAHFNPVTKQLKLEAMVTEPGNATRSEPAFHIHEDVNGILWVHPYGGGFAYFDRSKNRLVPFYNEPGASDWRFSNKLHSTMSDRQGNLWLCSHSKGLEKVTFINNEFDLETPEPYDYESLSNDVRALMVDKEGRLWASVREGMSRIYASDGSYLGYLTEDGTIARSGKPLKGVAYCFMQDKDGVVWIATKGDGLVRAEKEGSRYRLERYKYNADDIYSLSNNDVYYVHQDGKGRIWVATFGGGLNYMERGKDGKWAFINHRNNLKGYPIDRCYRVRHITSDRNGMIWVGTTTGALCFDENFTNAESVVFNHYSRVPSDPQSLSNNDVHWIATTKKGEVYVATFGGGLNKLISRDKDGKAVFKSYTVADGAPSDVMLSAREDSGGNLWISTENGLAKFFPQSGTFENYDEGRFDFSLRFNEGASAKSVKANRLYFGTTSGILGFCPDSVQKSTYVPDLVFSKFLVANVEMAPGNQGSILEKGIDDVESVELSHEENIFTLRYAALDFVKPENIKYAYFLEGFDEDWSYVDKQRTATYTNLPDGDYVFRVKSTNSEGVWVENERQLAITVLPSFWETPWAYFLYFVLFMLLVFVSVYVLFVIYRLKHEVSVEQQVTDIKLRFFTNISHELRTPLTLIAGPVEYVLKKTDLPNDVRAQLEIVGRNTDRMLRLVNQILDFRKIQNRKMKLQVQEVDVVPFVRRVMENFESMAEEHQIDFVFESETDSVKLWVDEDKLEKIVFNLLSNAFKYTPPGKMITVFVREEEKTVAIGVQDQGIGIPENKKASLFVRFENLVDKNLFNSNTTGIGLSLVKELVEMHKATIAVDSRLGEGSCFTVNFQKGKEHYDSSTEFILNDSNTAMGGAEANPADVEEELPETQKKTMLLVEDNLELRYFLRSIFRSDFRVIEAADGDEGWAKALNFVPDIIISDIIMPGKDGIALTKDIRGNMDTSHIPVVLLTAKVSADDRLAAIESGADDYITKPFSATYLKARVGNLLQQRMKLQESYRENLMNDPLGLVAEDAERPKMSASDQKFMDDLMELMEKNMDNGELIVDDLVRELAVSRSVFFKKLKTLTGLAPIEFIKGVRLKRAAQLIMKGDYNMTQISYMVGINDPRYFSKCFKQKFGMTPTEFKEKVAKA